MQNERSIIAVLVLVLSSVGSTPAVAQTPPDEPPPVPSFDITPPRPSPLPEPEFLPPAPPLTPPAPVLPPAADMPIVVQVDRFDVVGSTIFSAAELALATAPFTGRQLSFAELLQARSAVTQLYLDAGYITSAALIPPQPIENGVVQIQVIEGRLEEINISGTARLRDGYIRDRLRLAAAAPLNVRRLLEGLQLLQLDPLIETISADLQAGVRPGTSVLQVRVVEADTLNAQIGSDNNRSPSVGSVRRQVQVTQANLLGLGDGLSIGYSNTDGSNTWDASYTLPLNARNGTLRLGIGSAASRVIEPPFEPLDISASSRFVELSYRQPIAQSPTEEFAIGLTTSYQASRLRFAPFDLPEQGFPAPGADAQGNTRVTAIRLFQEWTQRSSRQVLAARSQFSLGVDWFGATVNENAPDSRFLAWRGQGQWVRLLAPDTLLLLRGDVQLSDSSLVPFEQFGLGGQATVRGYRQDALLTDNGALLSAEVRLPIARIRSIDGLLQVAPFVEVGTAWNEAGASPSPRTLVGTGLGLIWQQNRLSVRLDYGLPLISIESRERTLQESGLYFSIEYSP